MPEEKASSSGAFLPASLMYFCSGQPMHFCCGVDTQEARPSEERLIAAGCHQLAIRATRLAHWAAWRVE